jgi:hypothetical protein
LPRANAIAFADAAGPDQRDRSAIGDNARLGDRALESRGVGIMARSAVRRARLTVLTRRYSRARRRHVIEQGDHGFLVGKTWTLTPAKPRRLTRRATHARPGHIGA